MNHNFDTNIAADCGVNAAIIFQNFLFWIQKNKANGDNFYDGNYWTYNSVKSFKEIFYYLSDSQIRTAIKTLEEKGYIKKGNYNTNHYDRTLWYSIPNLESFLDYPDNKKADNKNKKSICDISQIEIGNNENGNEFHNNSLSYINTNINLDNKPNKEERKKDFYADYLENLQNYNSPFYEPMKDWLDYKGKKAYKDENSLKTLLKHLKDISNECAETAQKIVNQSIANNWKGLFELKQTQSKQFDDRTSSRYHIRPEDMDYSPEKMQW